MSKAFTREDDTGEEVALPDPSPRLPDGVVRYVTPEGHRALREELAGLESSSRRSRTLAATLPLLTVHAPRCEGKVVFGCWARLRDESGGEMDYRIVGPDEADARQRRLSVDSPLARALLGREAGETVSVELPRGPATYDIVAVGKEPFC